MRNFNSVMIAPSAVIIFSLPAIAQTEKTKLSPFKQMFDELAEKDKVLFDPVFNTYNLGKLSEPVTEDFEFFTTEQEIMRLPESNSSIRSVKHVKSEKPVPMSV